MNEDTWSLLYISVSLCIWLAGCILGRKWKHSEGHVIGFVLGFGCPIILMLLVTIVPIAFMDWASKVSNGK